MAEQPTDRDKTLRSVLTELSMGRLTVDEAYSKLDGLIRPAARTKSRSVGPLGVGLILLLIGTVFGGVGGFFAARSIAFGRDTAHAEGTVVRLERSGNKGNQIPIVRYTVDGREHEVRGDISSNMPPAVNSKVAVLYKTADPADAQINSFVERWLFPLIFCGIGGLLAMVGFVFILSAAIRKFVGSSGQSERFTV
jgi:hypothetical protein